MSAAGLGLLFLALRLPFCEFADTGAASLKLMKQKDYASGL